MFWFWCNRYNGGHISLFVCSEPKYSPSRLIQIVKSIKSKNEDFDKRQFMAGCLWALHNQFVKSEVYQNYPNFLKNAMTLKNQLLDGKLWSDAITSDVINKIVENQGNHVEKEAFSKWRYLILSDSSIYILLNYIHRSRIVIRYFPNFHVTRNIYMSTVIFWRYSLINSALVA